MCDFFSVNQFIENPGKEMNKLQRPTKYPSHMGKKGGGGEDNQ
jgi:hypothetical protein